MVGVFSVGKNTPGGMLREERGLRRGGRPSGRYLLGGSQRPHTKIRVHHMSDIYARLSMISVGKAAVVTVSFHSSK